MQEYAIYCADKERCDSKARKILGDGEQRCPDVIPCCPDDAAGDGAEQNCRGHNRNECKPDFQIPQGDGKKTGEHNICGHHHGKNGKTVGGTDTAFIHTAYLLWICAEAAFLQQKTPLLSFCDANTIKKRLAVR
jgi:hypothetical protein